MLAKKLKAKKPSVKTGGFLFVEKEKTEERERPGRKKEGKKERRKEGKKERRKEALLAERKGITGEKKVVGKGNLR